MLLRFKSHIPEISEHHHKRSPLSNPNRTTLTIMQQLAITTQISTPSKPQSEANTTRTPHKCTEVFRFLRKIIVLGWRTGGCSFWGGGLRLTWLVLTSGRGGIYFISLLVRSSLLSCCPVVIIRSLLLQHKGPLFLLSPASVYSWLSSVIARNCIFAINPNHAYYTTIPVQLV